MSKPGRPDDAIDQAHKIEALRAALERAESRARRAEAQLAALKDALPSIVEAAIDNPRFDFHAPEIAAGTMPSTVIAMAPCMERGARVAQLIRAAAFPDALADVVGGGQ